MAVVKGLTEFTDKEIKAAGDIAKTSDDADKAKRAKQFQLEMMAYNARSMRGDFDSY